MGKTKIEWTEHTWSPVTGCTKVSPGCKHCYAERMARRLAGRCGYPEAPHHFDVTLHPDRLGQPLERRKPTMYFVCSMSDLFHKDVPDTFLEQVWQVFYDTPQHTYQVLTKRPDRMLDWISRSAFLSNDPLLNVWLGVSVETSDYLWRIDKLLECPAAVRFLSLEPLLGPIDGLEPYLIDCEGCGNQGSDAYIRFEQSLCRACIKGQEGPGIDWVIVGSESGPGARPMDEDWVCDIRDQCIAADVAFFYKQAMINGKKVSCPELDGQQWKEFPDVQGIPI